MEKENSSIRLLDYISANALNGAQVLSHLEKATQELEFSNVLKGVIEQYRDIAAVASTELAAFNRKGKKPSDISKFTVYCSVNLQTLFDRSVSRLSQLVIENCVSGVIDISRELKKSEQTNSATELAKRLLAVEEGCFAQMKRFL